MKKARRTARNWWLLAVASYILVSVVMGVGLALSPNVSEGSRWVAFLYSFVAPFAILKQVFLQPANGRMWMGLGAVSLLFSACLWVLSRYVLESPEDERERQRRRRVEELKPK